MLSVFAELKSNLSRERKQKGIQRAIEKGVYKGVKQKINDEQIKTLKKESLVETAIARQVGCHRDIVCRLLKRAKFLASISLFTS